ncbi:MAG TPA: hypothetical protein VK960_07505, partial [Acidimicrobiia bacterium]|nr:hypothetical protein [Acidimicrobiia bacterium]
VETDGPDPGLVDRAREEFGDVVKVRAEYERSGTVRAEVAGRPWRDLYAEYHEEAHHEPASGELLELFAEIREEVVDAAP